MENQSKFSHLTSKQIQKIHFWPSGNSIINYQMKEYNVLFQVSLGTETKGVELLGEYHLGTKCPLVVVN